MATVRRRTWQTKDGPRTAWVVDYFDGTGTRRLKTFERQREAKGWLAQVQVDVKAGEHVADRASITVAKAAELWLETCRHGSPDGEHAPLEASTVREYERYVRYMTGDAIVGVTLNQLDRAMVDEFLKRLRGARRSTAMVRKVRTALSTLISHAQEKGKVGRNVLRDQQRRRRTGKRDQKDIVIPTKAELRAMLGDGESPLWFRAFLAIAVYGGLRASELRGLRWQHVDLEAGVLKVRQRADFAGRIGAPKSKAGNRDVPMTPTVRKLLAELHMAQGRPTDGLVFATSTGRPMNHSNIVKRCYNPLQDRLGIAPRYGLHALRHAAASLFIEQGMNPKRVQVLMGHSSITMTMDVYGKLFPAPDDDRAAMAKLEALLG
jgi:integrase